MNKRCLLSLIFVKVMHHAQYFRGAVDAGGEQFVAYFLPTEETLGKRKRDIEDEVEYVPDEE